MAILFTRIARVTSWTALQHLNRDLLLVRARQAGATRYRLYRNAKDAAQVLIVAELPDAEAVQEMDQMAVAQLNALFDAGVSDDRVWEATGCEGIG